MFVSSLSNNLKQEKINEYNKQKKIKCDKKRCLTVNAHHNEAYQLQDINNSNMYNNTKETQFIYVDV